MNTSYNGQFCDPITLQFFSKGLYYYLTGFYIGLALPAHLLILITLLVQSRKQKAYVYQVLVVCSETAMCCSVPFYAGGWFWMMSYTWYRRCWFCRWLTVHCSVFIVAWFGFNGNLMTLMIAVDRSLALWKPNLYRTLNHKKIQKIVAVTGLIFSFSLYIFELRRYDLTWDNNGEVYVAYQDEVYMNTAVARVLSEVHAVIRLFVSVLLITVSCGLLFLFKRYSGNAIKENHKNRINDKVLTKLTFTQCLFNSLDSVGVAGFYTIQYLQRFPLRTCPFMVLAGVYDMSIMFTDLANCYCSLLISGELRMMIASNVFGAFKKTRNTTAVLPIQESNAQSTIASGPAQYIKQ